MTIKEFAAQIGVSDKAIYKRLKREGIELSTLKTKGSSSLSLEGEARLRELYSLQVSDAIKAETVKHGEPGEVENPVEKPVESSTSASEKSNAEVERLKIEINRLEELNKALTNERDFLRGALERAQISLDRAQQLQAMATAKIPTPKAIPAGGEESGMKAWLRRHFTKKVNEGGES